MCSIVSVGLYIKLMCFPSIATFCLKFTNPLCVFVCFLYYFFFFICYSVKSVHVYFTFFNAHSMLFFVHQRQLKINRLTFFLQSHTHKTFIPCNTALLSYYFKVRVLTLFYSGKYPLTISTCINTFFSYHPRTIIINRLTLVTCCLDNPFLSFAFCFWFTTILNIKLSPVLSYLK